MGKTRQTLLVFPLFSVWIIFSCVAGAIATKSNLPRSAFVDFVTKPVVKYTALGVVLLVLLFGWLKHSVDKQNAIIDLSNAKRIALACRQYAGITRGVIPPN